MKKYLALLLGLVMVFGIHSGAFAQVDSNFSVDGFTIDINGQMRYKAYIRNIATNDTVTVADSGKTFIVTSAAGIPVDMQLPDSADGLVYHFIDGNGNNFTVNPDATDTMQYGSAAVGERLVSPGGQGDALTVIGTDDSVWFVIDYGVTYTRGGQ